MWMLRTKPGSSTRVENTLTIGPCRSHQSFFFFFFDQSPCFYKATWDGSRGGPFTTDRSEGEDISSRDKKFELHTRQMGLRRFFFKR